MKSVHGQRFGRAGQPSRAGRHQPADAYLHLVPLGARNLLARIARFPRGTAGPLRNLPSAMFSLYQMSIHGKLTDLGYGPAAKCYDCHGSHDILALSNPLPRFRRRTA